LDILHFCFAQTETLQHIKKQSIVSILSYLESNEQYYKVKKSSMNPLSMAGAPVYSTNIIDRHDIKEILLKMALNTITLIPSSLARSLLNYSHTPST
jgi:hypothetical protein